MTSYILFALTLLYGMMLWYDYEEKIEYHM